MESVVLKVIQSLYRKAFARKGFFKFNKFLFDLSLRGLGIHNFENDEISGESHFFRTVLAKQKSLTVLDVGSNRGDYATRLKGICPGATIYAFEPHPKIFQALQREAVKNNYQAFNFGFGDREGPTKLFDRRSETDGSQHATLYREVIEEIHGTPVASVDVEIRTIDSFVSENPIERVTLLKIDTEGNEFNVLLGAADAIKNDMIDMIQIEFNEMNTVSRVFFRDFHSLLRGYDFYRLLPNGLLPIRKYQPIYCELFAFQNLLLVRKDLNIGL
jgi:FkbM family methyltransferase